jgi:hypothetical protein
MARRPPSEPPAEKDWTPDSIRVALRKIRRRMADVENFDPLAITGRSDTRVIGLEASLKETLADVFGANTRSYRNYQAAASLDTAGLNMNGTPRHEVVQGLAHGKARSLTLLSSAIRFFEEKMQDDFPGEPLDQVALSGRASIMVTGSGGIQGAGVEALAGNVIVSVENGTSKEEARFEELKGRVALLETSLSELRREIRKPEIGIGHNRGPDFAPVPVEDLKQIDDLIALLKEQRPTPPSDSAELVELSERATHLSARINSGLMSLGVELAKGAAREGGRHLLIPLWTAVSHGIDWVVEALRVWIP